MTDRVARQPWKMRAADVESLIHRARGPARIAARYRFGNELQ
jgi:hypothetical protein